MTLIQEYTTGVKLIESPYFQDDRGSFLKVFQENQNLFGSFSIEQVNFVETYQVFTIRGLHFQKGEYAESKYFRCVEGAILLVCLDLREESKTYLNSNVFELSNSKTSILVPRGFATGYCTLIPNSKVLYLSDNQYNSDAEGGVQWNDEVLKNVDWKTNNPIVSEKDKNWKNWLK
jgi:dTDP-4-dehydrorhamnose 3,5-epimerase